MEDDNLLDHIDDDEFANSGPSGDSPANFSKKDCTKFGIRHTIMGTDAINPNNNI